MDCVSPLVNIVLLLTGRSRMNVHYNLLRFQLNFMVLVIWLLMSKLAQLTHVFSRPQLAFAN
jgi:hypothetical protein